MAKLLSSRSILTGWTDVVIGMRPVIEELAAHSVFDLSEIGDAFTAEAPRCRADLQQH